VAGSSCSRDCRFHNSTISFILAEWKKANSTVGPTETMLNKYQSSHWTRSFRRMTGPSLIFLLGNMGHRRSAFRVTSRILLHLAKLFSPLASRNPSTTTTLNILERRACRCQEERFLVFYSPKRNLLDDRHRYMCIRAHYEPNCQPDDTCRPIDRGTRKSVGFTPFHCTRSSTFTLIYQEDGTEEILSHRWWCQPIGWMSNGGTRVVFFQSRGQLEILKDHG
jgi:hypothetical protein